ncbi:MAG TPA: hypothetical protein VK506_12580 [Conexibacter sp.]|nr:hypothetical protein [Conexibacter sp.]
MSAGDSRAEQRSSVRRDLTSILRGYLLFAGAAGVVWALVAAFSLASFDVTAYQVLLAFGAAVALVAGVIAAVEARKPREQPLLAPVGVAIAPDGRVYVADRDRSQLVQIQASGEVEPVLRRLGTFDYWAYSAYGVAVADDGAVLYADARHQCVRRIQPGGEEDLFGGREGLMSADVSRPSQDGEQVLSRPVALAAVGDGALVCTVGDDRVWRVNADRTQSVVAGAGGRGGAADGTPAVEARLRSPRGVTVDARGRVVFSERWGHVVRVVLDDGTLATLAGNGERGRSGDGGPATQARLSGPTGVAAGVDGCVYVADTGNGRVVRVDPDGAFTTIAEDLGAPHGLALDRRGALYVADARGGRLWRLDPDGTITQLISGSGERPDAPATNATEEPSLP